MNKTVFETIIRARAMQEDILRDRLSTIMIEWKELTKDINQDAMDKILIPLVFDKDYYARFYIAVGDSDISIIDENGGHDWYRVGRYDSISNYKIKRIISLIEISITRFFREYQNEIDELMIANAKAKAIIEKFK